MNTDLPLERPLELFGEERLAGQRHTWLHNIRRGMAPVTMRWGYTYVGSAIEADIAAANLQKGAAAEAWLEDTRGRKSHDLELLLDGDVLVVKHTQDGCDVCRPYPAERW